ncbi:MAG: hypothetical protein KDI68_16855 [Gammaproteobacteria bacterium]|nr:hypothetical protein [Gammaproteobacteria bacterium]
MMKQISGKLRIGEKIGLGFGLVGLIFLAVIWRYHNTLQATLGDYRQLLDENVTGEVAMLSIESEMRAAGRAEKSFLLLRDERSAKQVQRHIVNARQNLARLAETGADNAETATRIDALVDSYRETFDRTVEAWQRKGLDHNSGLQGAFRDAVHELEAMAGHFKVDNLYLQLLQIRRSEKDLGLRREAQYQNRVRNLIGEFERKIDASELEQRVKQHLHDELQIYRETFASYAQSALQQADINGGKGPFREAAHRIEDLLRTHHLPDLASEILQLRRREKDYLLRHDKRYVEMALDEWSRIHATVEPSEIAPEQKRTFMTLLNNYRRDFLALVEQNDRIAQMTAEMAQAVGEITAVVRKQVESANRNMAEKSKDIEAGSERQERLMMALVAAALLLGVLFAFLITVRIVRPLRSMAGILDQLTHQETGERLPYHPNGRDEVNEMAGSVNMMAENRARFIGWWQSAMREANACEALERVLQAPERGEDLRQAKAALQTALAARNELLFQQLHKLHRLNGDIMQRADALGEEWHLGKAESHVEAIQYASRSAQNILEMVAYQEQHNQAESEDKAAG